jgi:hypothetical protein
MTIVIKRIKGVAPIGFDDLFEPEPASETLPSAWNGPHVGMRIAEAFATLKQMPLGDRIGMRSVWPRHIYEWEDLLAQQEQGELERTQAEQNRTRIAPSATEIANMENASHWPARYLSQLHPQLCEAVNAVAMAYSLGLDSRWVTRKRGGYADTWRDRHDRGCEIIAAGLQRDCVPVF